MATRDDLASDRRAGWSARTSIRERHRALLRSQWRPLAEVGAATLLPFVVAALLADGPLQRGFFLGAGVTFAAWASRRSSCSPAGPRRS